MKELLASCRRTPELSPPSAARRVGSASAATIASRAPAVLAHGAPRDTGGGGKGGDGTRKKARYECGLSPATWDIGKAASQDADGFE